MRYAVLVVCRTAAVALACLQGAAWPQTIVRSNQINWDFSGQPVPRYKGGFVVAYDLDHVTVRAFDRAGALVATGKLTLPGAVKVMVRDVAVAPGGDFVMTATAQDGSGRTASVIAWMDHGGSLLRVVRTSPFAPFQICFANDGTLWAVGRVHDDSFNDVPGHDIIRLYDPEGRMLKSLLPSDSFTPVRWHPAHDSFLVSGKDRMGFYSINAAEWVEMSLSGELLGRWKTAPLPEGTTLVGAGLTSSADVYLSGFQFSKGTSGGSTERIPSSVLFRLDKSRGELAPVDATPLMGVWKDTVLLGAEEQQLVFYRKAPRGLDWVVMP
jgi:WD40 repeat protein